MRLRSDSGALWRLFEFVQERRNRTDVLAVGNQLALVLDARIGALAALEVGAVHFLALRTVPNADAQKIEAAH